MISRETRDELCRKMNDVIMTLVAVARAEDDVSADLAAVAQLLSEARRRLEQTMGKVHSG
jgi:hypothetical protein